MTYKKHPVLKEPTPSQALWRYMDFPKFVSIIQNNSLFFASLTILEDPKEGLPSKMNFNPKRIIPVRENDTIRFSTLQEFLGDNFNNHIQSSAQRAVKLRKCFFINSWHMNNDESDSQWKIYGNTPYSLAIISSFENLCDSIIDPIEIHGSIVNYYSPDQDTTPEGNGFFPVINKRWAYIHEREFRLIHFKPELIQSSAILNGVSIKINVKKMIQSIVIAPNAPTWFIKVVKCYASDSGISIPISQSDLYNPINITNPELSFS